LAEKRAVAEKVEKELCIEESSAHISTCHLWKACGRFIICFCRGKNGIQIRDCQFKGFFWRPYCF